MIGVGSLIVSLLMFEYSYVSGFPSGPDVTVVPKTSLPSMSRLHSSGELDGPDPVLPPYLPFRINISGISL